MAQLLYIDQVQNAEDDVHDGNPEDKRPLPAEGKRSENPVIAMLALDKPSPADDPAAIRAFEDSAQFSLFPQFNILLEFTMHVETFSAAFASYLCGLKIVPDRFLSAYRAFDYKHGVILLS
jgi:hypothetical protein